MFCKDTKESPMVRNEIMVFLLKNINKCYRKISVPNYFTDV